MLYNTEINRHLTRIVEEQQKKIEQLEKELKKTKDALEKIKTVYSSECSKVNGEKKKKKYKKIIPKKIRIEVLERDEYRCRDCRCKSSVYNLHHIIPRSEGGEETVDNLITLCEHCHIERHKGEDITRLMKSRMAKETREFTLV
jgi:predicted RNase H-like nuclease (RuvC/YqgF family)